MAYVTSNNYKNNIYSESSNSYLKIYINNVEIDTDYVRDITLDDDVFEEEAFTLGSAIIQSITLKLDNICLPCQAKDVSNVRIDYGLEVDNNTIEWIPIGTYDVGKEPDTTYSDYTTFTLYDYMNRFDKEYDASSIVPCTRYQLVQDMCQKCNVELGSQNFLNGNITVNSYDNTITAKNYLSFISERSAGFAKIGRDGKLYIKSFSDVDVISLSDEDSQSVSVINHDSLKTISKVIYENAIDKYEFGDNTGITIKLSSDNPLNIDENEVQAIYNSINNLSFQSVDIKMWIDPAYDTGDILCVSGLRTFIQKKFNYGNGFYGKYKTTLKDINTKSNVNKISNSTKIKKYQAKIDELNGEISILSQEIDEQTEQTSEILETVDSLQLRVNKIENSINDASGANVLYLEQSLPRSLEYLSIKGNISTIQSGSIYLNEQLTLKGIYLIVDKTRELSSDVKKIKLPFEYLRQYNDVSDEFIFNNGECQIIRRIGIDENNDYYVLEEEIIEELEDIEIQLFDGDNYIYVSPNFNTQLYAIYPKKQASDIYATKVEVSSAIQETADSITLQTSEKFDDQNSRISTIQNTLDGVNITVASQKTELDSLSGQLVSIDGSLSEMQFKFNTDALKIAKTNDPVNSTIDNTGLKVYNYTTLKAIFNNNGSGIDTLIVTGTAQIGYLKFLKTIDGGKKYTDIFHLEELISDLTDLEVSS